MPKRAKKYTSRSTSFQTSTSWHNKIEYKQDTGERYKLAFKEVTQWISDKQEGKLKDCVFTYEQVIREVNQKWSLDGEGRKNTHKWLLSAP